MPGSEGDLWDVSDLGAARYEKGLRIANHFEVVERQGNEIYIRCGGSPLLAPGLRASDGLIVLSARVDREAQQAEFRFKTALFSSAGEVAPGAEHPIPPKIVAAHKWYVRALTQAAIAKVKA